MCIKLSPFSPSFHCMCLGAHIMLIFGVSTTLLAKKSCGKWSTYKVTKQKVGYLVWKMPSVLPNLVWGTWPYLLGGHPFWGLKFSTCQQHPNAVTCSVNNKVKWVPKNQITKFGALVNQSNTMTLNNTSHHNKKLFLKKNNILCSWVVSQLSRDLQPKTFTLFCIISFYSRSC
jgi:hypothetical protein